MNWLLPFLTGIPVGALMVSALHLRELRKLRDAVQTLRDQVNGYADEEPFQ